MESASGHTVRGMLCDASHEVAVGSPSFLFPPPASSGDEARGRKHGTAEQRRAGGLGRGAWAGCGQSKASCEAKGSVSRARPWAVFPLDAKSVSA